MAEVLLDRGPDPVADAVLGLGRPALPLQTQEAVIVAAASIHARGKRLLQGGVDALAAEGERLAHLDAGVLLATAQHVLFVIISSTMRSFSLSRALALCATSFADLRDSSTYFSLTPMSRL